MASHDQHLHERTTRGRRRDVSSDLGGFYSQCQNQLNSLTQVECGGWVEAINDVVFVQYLVYCTSRLVLSTCVRRTIPVSRLSLDSTVGQSMRRSPPNLCTLPPGGQSES